jgi:TonB-dependent receptor
VLFTQSSTFGSDTLDVPGLDRSTYAFSRVANAGDGTLSGFELFYSQTAQSLVDSLGAPDWLGGFGIRASGTWTDSEVNIPAGATGPAARIQALPGTSDETYNLQLTYEKYDLSVRLAYQFRTAWVQGYGNYTTVAGQLVPNGNGDIYWDDDGELDLSIRYQVNDNLEWFFDAVNLSNSPAIRFADSNRYPIEYEQFGERYITGVRFNF